MRTEKRVAILHLTSDGGFVTKDTQHEAVCKLNNTEGNYVPFVGFHDGEEVIYINKDHVLFVGFKDVDPDEEDSMADE